MRPSQSHGNKSLRNWLVYELVDKALKDYSGYLHGDLYDLGCGEAPFKDYLLKFVDTYTGVDWAESQHNAKPDVVSDFNVKIDLRGEVADSILSISVLEHLYAPQVFLCESYRILRPGGWMVLQVPWQWRVHEAPHDYCRYTPYGLRYMFGEAGFEDIQVQAQAGVFTTVLLKLNYFSSRLVRGPKPWRVLVTTILAPLWILGQVAAPWLDRLDRCWELETPGYFVLARKR